MKFKHRHRELFSLYWKRKSKTASHAPKLAEETIALIRKMAKDNRLWDAERIRGELLKLGIRVCKRTIQKDMRTVRTKPPRGQKWSTFLRNHAANIWACDALSGDRPFLSAALCFLPHRAQITTSDPCWCHTIPFRCLGGATTARSPALWTSAKVPVRDNDSKFGPFFARVAMTSGIEILKTQVHAPRANAICERFMRSVRQECLDHLLIFQEKQLQRVRKRV